MRFSIGHGSLSRPSLPGGGYVLGAIVFGRRYKQRIAALEDEVRTLRAGNPVVVNVGQTEPVVVGSDANRETSNDLSLQDLNRLLLLLQKEGNQHRQLGAIEEVWSAVWIFAKRLDRLGIAHPEIEADEPAWRWWSFVRCLIPHIEAQDMEAAKGAMEEMLKIMDPYPYPWDKKDD